MGLKPVILTKTVTTAGTEIAVSSTDLYVTTVYFEALSTNTGVIFVGDLNVTSTLYMTRLAAGAGFSLSVPSPIMPGSSSGGNELNLKHLYVDCSVNGEKVQVSYLQRVGSN